MEAGSKAVPVKIVPRGFGETERRDLWWVDPLLPLIVLSASPDWNDPFAPDDVEPLIDEVHQRLQAELLNLSTRSKQIVATKAGHNIQAEEPQLVIDAILDVVAQARKK